MINHKMPRVVYTLSERIEMVREHFQGISYRHIVDHFAVAHPDRPIPSPSTVRRIVKDFQNTGNIDPAKKPKTIYPNRRLSEETQSNIFLAVVEARGKKPLSAVAKELEVSISSVYRTLSLGAADSKGCKNTESPGETSIKTECGSENESE